MSANVGKSHIWKSARGNKGGTWAAAGLAIAYAKYLSPEFHAWANRVIIERMEDEARSLASRELNHRRKIRKYKRDGKSEPWIQRRLDSFDVRHQFTDTLQDHSVTSTGYGICTNAIYQPILGGTASEVKTRLGLSKKDSLRDNLTTTGLAAVSLGEAMASDAIEKQNLHGETKCALACQWSAKSVAIALEHAQRTPDFLNEN
jgi:hypothetical protein